MYSNEEVVIIPDPKNISGLQENLYTLGRDYKSIPYIRKEFDI